ncbi:Exodeoxyribonuclease [Candidatus Kinetoplastibacterium sorsogonicusi]|uniref:Exodeoxyribonuclease n=1 Tax=Candidatus Kinetoplastidibacterium kentomonadis TaxID=1576550 RepID=A0A3Q8EUL8_9PROT|nr:exodeoxyribonuclease III [Candidatus Kinetoplastibacterium sorsogonicusi]AWD32742.1 Exodeoxyribonuclease [Candidatus Kinetoplastibacterium sorsogonicusi]
MLKITSINLNGIRSAFNKGLLDWLETNNIDIVCTQEIKISKESMCEKIYNPNNYLGYFFHAKKNGYSGVNIYIKKNIHAILSKTCIDNIYMNDEGRVMRLDIGKLSIINLYLPSGSYNILRQKIKFQILNELKIFFNNIKKENYQTGQEFIICGDFNIAHKEIDIKNWKQNKNHPGFLPEERKWLDDIFSHIGLVDVFRLLNPNPNNYTWWSNRGNAWANNVGWRIDYQIATPNIAKLALSCNIYKDQKFSDHAPLTVSYNYSI